MGISPSEKICKEICDALGLKHVKKLDIHMAVDKIVTGEAVFYPEVDGVRQIVPILRKFELIPKSDVELEPIMISDNAADVTGVGEEYQKIEWVLGKEAARKK